MAGVLQFTIGLEASQFLHACGLSSGAIIGLERAGAGLKSVMEKVWSSIDQAKELNHLAARTGETAGNLFKMQEGFKACGVDAGSLGQTLFFMQKSLGGINDVGESTSDIFGKMGLSIRDLKGMGQLEAFSTIITKLGTYSQDTAAKFASGIFGRMGAGNAVQLSRSAKEFQETMAAAGPQAAIFARMAAGAELLNRSLFQIKLQLTGLWAGIAEGAIPGLQKVFDYLKAIDLTDVGKRLGAVIGLLGESLGSGKFSEMLSLAIEVGFEKGEFFAVRLAGSLGAALMVVVPKALEAAFQMSKMAGRTFSSMSLEWDLSRRKAYVAELEREKASQANTGSWSKGDEAKLTAARASEQLTKSAIAVHSRESMESTVESIKKLSAEIATSMPQAMAAAQEAWKSIGGGPDTDASKHLAALMADFQSRLQALLPAVRTDSGKAIEFGKGMHHRTEGNVFEKMGFVTGGGGPAQDTAHNTAKLVTLFEQVRDGIFRENMRRGQTDWATNDIL
jgi:hypothetical protein